MDANLRLPPKAAWRPGACVARPCAAAAPYLRNDCAKGHPGVLHAIGAVEEQLGSVEQAAAAAAVAATDADAADEGASDAIIAAAAAAGCLRRLELAASARERPRRRRSAAAPPLRRMVAGAGPAPAAATSAQGQGLRPDAGRTLAPPLVSASFNKNDNLVLTIIIQGFRRAPASQQAQGSCQSLKLIYLGLVFGHGHCRRAGLAARILLFEKV